jgi:hypothetical protein
MIIISEYCQENNLMEIARNSQMYHNEFLKATEKTTDSSLTNFKNQVARKDIIQKLCKGKSYQVRSINI